MLTQLDLKAIGRMVDKAVKKSLGKYPAKAEFGKLYTFIKQLVDNSDSYVNKDDIKHLPTKDEFYTEMDKIYGRFDKIEEAQTILTGRVYDDHEERITKIETHLGFQTS